MSSPQHEPTMEEILASIRKIISEDSPEQQPAPVAEVRPVAPPPPPEPVEQEADILELTQEVAPEPPVMAAPEPAHSTPVPEPDVVFQTVEEPVATEEPSAPASEGIFSEENRKALEETFSNISAETYVPAPAPSAPAAASGLIDGSSVQAVFERAVREAFVPVINEWLANSVDPIIERMKPLIQDWMNEHFASLLRDMVRDELTRTDNMKPLIHGRLDERFPEILGAVRSEVERVAKANLGKR